MSSFTEQRLQTTIAKSLIHDLLVQYCRGINRCDQELLASVFHPTATVEYGIFNGAAADFCVQVMGTIRSQKRTQHTVCNEFIELSGNKAFGETYFVAYMQGLNQETDELMEVEVGGRYLDHFVLESGRWTIFNRAVVIDWNTVNRAQSTEDMRNATEWGEPGIAGRTDPLYRIHDNTKVTSTYGGASQLSNDDLGVICDRREIYDVVMQYCRGIDRCDEAALRGIYHADAYEEHQVFNGTAKDFCDFILPLVRQHLTGMHSIRNILIEVEGSTATSESYFVAYATDEHEDGKIYDRSIGGRYLDRFEKRDGKWKIAYRQVVMDWNRFGPTTAVWDEGMFASFKLIGKHGQEDPLYAHRSKVLGSVSG